MNGRRLDIASGHNVIEPPLGFFRVQIVDEALGDPQAKLIATILPPPHLTERQRSSGISSTVEVSTSFEHALRLAVDIFRAARAAQIDLPAEVSLR